MGQQQLLLIILGVIIVGIAIAVGLQLFQSGAVDSNQDAMINDMMNVTAVSDQWRIRPTSMGGGGGDFTTELVTRVNNNEGLTETANGTYTVALVNGTTITITGESSQGYGQIVLTYNVDPTAAERYGWAGGTPPHEGGIGG